MAAALRLGAAAAAVTSPRTPVLRGDETRGLHQQLSSRKNSFIRESGTRQCSSSKSSSSSSSRRLVVTAGKGGSTGVFAPIVILVRNLIGMKRFNLIRGKGIALHSQVITEFCKSIGADGKVRQGLIRVAKKNGEKLGFLA